MMPVVWLLLIRRLYLDSAYGRVMFVSIVADKILWTY